MAPRGPHLASHNPTRPPPSGVVSWLLVGLWSVYAVSSGSASRRGQWARRSCRPRPLIRGDPIGVVDTVKDRLPCGCLWSSTEPFCTVHGGWDGRGSRRRTCAAGRQTHARHARHTGLITRHRHKRHTRRGSLGGGLGGSLGGRLGGSPPLAKGKEEEVSPPLGPFLWKFVRNKNRANLASTTLRTADIGSCLQLTNNLLKTRRLLPSVAPLRSHARRAGLPAGQEFRRRPVLPVAGRDGDPAQVLR